MYDVVIVGAGPSGASAAYFLGEAGQRVLVLEKEKLPRYKTCGGGLSTRMLAACSVGQSAAAKSVLPCMGAQAIEGEGVP